MNFSTSMGERFCSKVEMISGTKDKKIYLEFAEEVTPLPLHYK